jgi:hypothetical protein
MNTCLSNYFPIGNIEENYENNWIEH